jgi:hypothetical protein
MVGPEEIPDPEREAAIRRYVDHLSHEEKLLVVLKRELYEGQWEHMLSDLQDRLEGRPYIFKLVNRITEDIERIRQLAAFEREHAIDLADYVAPEIGSESGEQRRKNPSR